MAAALMKLIFAVLDVSLTMGLTRSYKTEGFFTFITRIKPLKAWSLLTDDSNPHRANHFSIHNEHQKNDREVKNKGKGKKNTTKSTLSDNQH